MTTANEIDNTFRVFLITEENKKARAANVKCNNKVAIDNRAKILHGTVSPLEKKHP